METVGSYEAKTHLPRLLERTARGEQITITKHGVPVAMLVPIGPSRKKGLQAVIEELKGFNKGQTTGGITIKAMIEERRR